MNHTVRPLHLPPGWAPIHDRDRVPHQFRSTLTQTFALLAAEVRQLGADTFVLGVDATERAIRRDGQLRADAILAGPTVQVFIESRHGPLVYTADGYRHWDGNLRGIALALQALRAVDRYGVTRRGEQYLGWTAIDSKPAVMTREQAADFIADLAANHGHDVTGALLLSRPDLLKQAYVAAAKRAHPDRARDDGDTMARLNVARDLLSAGERR